MVLMRDHSQLAKSLSYLSLLPGPTALALCSLMGLDYPKFTTITSPEVCYAKVISPESLLPMQPDRRMLEPKDYQDYSALINLSKIQYG